MRLADLNGRSVAVWGTGRRGRAAVLAAVAVQRPSRLLAVDDSATPPVAWSGSASRRRWPVVITPSRRW